MNRLFKTLSATVLALTTANVLADLPKALVTINNTKLESNAFIDGIVRSVHPTLAGKTSEVPWAKVVLACFGHTKENKCKATIKMGTDTPATEFEIGSASMDMKSGLIAYTKFPGSEYTITVTGPGKTVITKDNP